MIAPLYFLANALEALTAAWLLRRVATPFRLESLREVAALAVLGAGIAPMVGATVIATVDVILGKHAFMTAWSLVWLGDGSGLLVSTPLTLVAVEAFRERARIGRQRIAEAAVLTVLLVGIGALAFNGTLPTAYMTMPVLLWAAIRYQLRGAAAALAILTLTTAVFTLAGEGEFAGHPELLQQKVVMLQAFLGISAVSALLAAVLSQQHRAALASLRQLNLDLEARVVQRTATLRESEGKLALFVEHAPAAIAMFDREMRCLACSRHFIADYGLPPPDQVIGRPHEALLPFLPQQWRAALPEVLAGAEPAREEDEFRRADGRTDWIRWSMKPWRVADGRIGGALLVSELITAQVLARQALAANEQMLRLAQEAGELGAWEYDHPANAATWSAQTRTLLDVDPDTPASLAAFLARIHPEDRAAIEAQVSPPPGPGEEAGYDGEFRILRRDGGVRWLRHRGRFERAASGAPVRSRGVIWDITQRKLHEEQLRLLMQEFNHRSRNMLTLVQAIARQSSGGARDFTERFERRILALAANQDLLMRDDGLGADLDTLIRTQLKPFVDPSSTRLSIAGPRIALLPAAAQSVGMAMHELATNAVKYGSLSAAAGRVEIAWSVTPAADAGAEAIFRMAWRELGGPPVAPPERTGFGVTVITRMMEGSLRSSVDLDYRADGFRWSITAPLSAVGTPEPEAAQQAAG